MGGMRRAALLMSVAALVSGGLSAPARADTPLTALLVPGTLAPGSSSVRVLLDPTLPAVTAVTDLSGEFSFTAPMHLLGAQKGVFASLPSSGVTDGPHDLDLTLADGSHRTCQGCLAVGQPLAAPTGSLTPQDGALALSLSAPGPADGVTSYRVLLSDGSFRDVPTETSVLTGLNNGTNYSLLVAAVAGQRAGQALPLSGRPGRPPASPTVKLTPGLNSVTANATTTADGYDVTYSYTVTVGSGQPTHVTTNDPLVVHAPGRQVVSVSATATSQLGASVASAPVHVTSYGPPSVPRLLRTRYADGVLTSAWTPPVTDGGTPVKAYDVTTTVSGSRSVRRVATTSLARAVPAGASITVAVRAVTAVAVGDEAIRSVTADVGELVALDAGGHVRRRLLASGSWTSLGGPVLTGTPSLARTSRGDGLVVAADSSGRVWGWTHASGWRVISTTRCRRPAAALDGANTLTVACVGSDGRLLATNRRLTSSAVPTGLRFSRFAAKPLGRLAAVDHVVVFRVAPFDGAGHNVLAVNPFGSKTSRLPLACASDPGAGTGQHGDGWVACLASGSKLLWLHSQSADLSAQRSTAFAALPFRARGQAGVFGTRYGDRGEIAVVDEHGVVQELDTAFRTLRVASGLRVQAGVSVLQLRG